MYSWDLHHSKYNKQNWITLEASSCKLQCYYNKCLTIYSNRTVIFFEFTLRYANQQTTTVYVNHKHTNFT